MLYKQKEENCPLSRYKHMGLTACQSKHYGGKKHHFQISSVHCLTIWTPASMQDICLAITADINFHTPMLVTTDLQYFKYVYIRVLPI